MKILILKSYFTKRVIGVKIFTPILNFKVKIENKELIINF